MWIVAVWVIFALLVGGAAHERGRCGLCWLLLALVISPLIAGLIVAIMPDLRTRGMLRDIADASNNIGAVDDRALRRNIER
jgi:hypothetical protein